MSSCERLSDTDQSSSPRLKHCHAHRLHHHNMVACNLHGWGSQVKNQWLILLRWERPQAKVSTPNPSIQMAPPTTSSHNSHPLQVHASNVLDTNGDWSFSSEPFEKNVHEPLYGEWLSSRANNTDCLKFLQWPFIVIGVSIMDISLAGFVGACYRNTSLLRLYLFVMFFIFAMLLRFFK